MTPLERQLLDNVTAEAAWSGGSDRAWMGMALFEVPSYLRELVALAAQAPEAKIKEFLANWPTEA